MKKTGKLVCAVALLLAALMLFSACSISYRTAETADYIQIADDAFKKIALSIDKMVVDADDVIAYIDALRYEKRGDAIKNSFDTTDPYIVGALAAYDVLTLRTILYDEEGNLVATDFTVDTKNTTSSSVALNAGVSLPLGYPQSLNEGLKAWLEEQLYGDGSNAVNYDAHIIAHNLLGTEATGITALPEIVYCTYSSAYGSASGNKATAVTPLHIAKYLAKETQGKNSYEEAIALGLKQVIEKYAEDASPVKPGDVIKINIYPTANGVPEGSETSKTAAHIAYDLDFSDVKTGTTYDEGYISVTLKGDSGLDMNSTAWYSGEATYTYPSDAEGTYTTATGEKHDLKGTKCYVYAYFESRSAYNYPAYDETFIKETAGFASETTDLAALKAEYEESVRKTLQDECDAVAKKNAMSRLWDAAVKSATLIKEPTANIKAYVKNEMNYYKSYYYDYGYASSGYYDSFDDFVITMVGSTNGITYDSLAAVENAIYAEGRAQVKENLLTYYIADALSVRLTQEQLDEKLMAYATKAALEEVEYLRETYTITDSDSESTKESKKAFLATYGYTDASQIPDDFYTAEDVYDAIMDDKDSRESIYGGFQLDAVLEKLYEVNYADGAGTMTYSTVDYDADALSSES